MNIFKLTGVLVLLILLPSFTIANGNIERSKAPPHNQVSITDRCYYDDVRARDIPVRAYFNPNTIKDTILYPVIIINHGYTVKNTEYSFIAEHLANKGHYVFSIQHDLPGDAELPRDVVNIYNARKPFWDNGIKNIVLVLSKIKIESPELNTNELILIGHSNGGDISMMFADKYSKLVKSVISLDSLRYPFPVNSNVEILYFSANDTDDIRTSVLPHSKAKIISLQDTKHIEMCDHGSDKAKNSIASAISDFVESLDS